MKNIIYLFIAIILVGIGLNSCNNQENNHIKTAIQDTPKKPEIAVIMDPNQPKPMALMMRLMAANADSFKAKISRGETLDSLQFPFLHFYYKK